ncbi:MAG: class I SAM-dependent methyltransferase [Bryobacteraceae bacterium]
MNDSHGSEEARIRAAYARMSREFPVAHWGWNRPANLFFHTGIVRGAIELLDQARLYPVSGLRIADIGCGSGTWLCEFVQWGASPCDLYGIDLLADRAAAARGRLPTAQIVTGSAGELPWEDASFDLTTQFVVFSSILDDTMRRRVAGEMLRVLRPGGHVLWYDLRRDNPGNRSVRCVPRDELRSLFPGCPMRLMSATLAPPLARAVTPVSWTAATVLERIGWLRTHYLALIRKPGRE